MPFLELFDETLDINSTGNYEMTVQAGQDGLAYCLLDTLRNKFVLIRSYEPEENKYFSADNIGELLGTDDFLSRRYRKVRIVMPSPKFTIVPAPLFDPGKKDEYFAFNHVYGEGNTIIANKLGDPDSFLVFAVQTRVLDLLSSYHPGIYPLHHVKPLLCQVSHNRKSVSGLYIQLHVEREYFNLVVFEHNLMKFCNSYKFRNITDIMYFTLNVFRTLGIRQEETIYLSGDTEKYDDLYSNLSLYIRNVRYAGPAGNFTFSYVFNDLALHRYINLFSAIHCE